MESKEDKALHQHPIRRKPTTCAQLPAELVNEILLRLPVKTLLKFRCVSKSCLALISSTEFINTHHSLSANNKDYTHHKVIVSSRIGGHTCDLKECTLRSLFYDDSVIEAKKLDYQVGVCDYRYSRFVGSVNGLICLILDDKNFFLWNPSIRRYKILPYFGSLKARIWKIVCGFGYDEFHNDYKVMVSSYAADRCNEVKIYSLNNDSWTSIDDLGWLLNGQVMFVNGKLHWIVFDRIHDNSMNIISFDLANEKREKMELPCCGEEDLVLRLGVLRGDLSSFSEYKRTRLDVWVMKEYGVKESWIKILTIKYGFYDFFHPPLFMSNKDEILAMLGSTFRIYNLKDDSFKSTELINFATYSRVDIYVESLVCPF